MRRCDFPLGANQHVVDADEGKPGMICGTPTCTCDLKGVLETLCQVVKRPIVGGTVEIATDDER